MALQSCPKLGQGGQILEPTCSSHRVGATLGSSEALRELSPLGRRDSLSPKGLVAEGSPADLQQPPVPEGTVGHTVTCATPSGLVRGAREGPEASLLCP